MPDENKFFTDPKLQKEFEKAQRNKFNNQESCAVIAFGLIGSLIGAASYFEGVIS
jgi:hypothetical protein